MTLPQRKNYEYAYEQAYQLACAQLAGIDDIEEQCRRSGSQYQVTDSQEAVVVQYLNQPYLITLPDIEISLAGSAEEVPKRDRLLILHYFICARGTPPANRLITIRELPEGGGYSPTFGKRTVKPLADYFGKEPHLLIEAAKKLGGRKADYGDAAETIDAFSRVPITLVIWQGDDELAPQGSVLFDASISDYLPTEDITVVCEIITWRLVGYLRDLILKMRKQ